MKKLSIFLFIFAIVVLVSLNAKNLFLTTTFSPSLSSYNTSSTTTSVALSTASLEVSSSSATTTAWIPAQKTTFSFMGYGKNDDGQLAGTLFSKNVKQEFNVKVPGKIVKTYAGRSHTVALTAAGRVVSWGGNDFGQLGYTTKTKDSAVPQEIPGLEHITSLATTNNHTLAIDSDGNVYAWGSNFTGQLGDGTNNDRTTPQKVSGLPKIKAISASHKFSLALDTDGNVWAWGATCKEANKKAALALLSYLGSQLSELQGGYYDYSSTGGTGYDINQDCINEDAVNIHSLVPKKLAISNVKTISSGYGHALFLKTDGTVIGMGCNTHGQLAREPGTLKGQLVKIQGLPPVVAAVAGARHSLFLDKDGTIYGVGANQYGQIAAGTQKNKMTPTKIENIPPLKKIVAGFDYSIGIDKTGGTWAWGMNVEEFIKSHEPLRMDYPVKLFDTEPVSIGTGGSHIIFQH